MKFKDLMDVLSVNVGFEISDPINNTGMDFDTFMHDAKNYRTYADRKVKLVKPAFNPKYKTYLTICLE